MSAGDDYQLGFAIGPPAFVVDASIYSQPENWNFNTYLSTIVYALA